MRAHMGAREIRQKPVTANGMERARIWETQPITTNYLSLQILNVISLIIEDVFNTDAHRQWR